MKDSQRKIILFGAGQAAKWIYEQISHERVVSVVDFYNEGTRLIKEFNGFEVKHYSSEKRIFANEYILLLAIGSWDVARHIDEVVEYVGEEAKERIYLMNPYVSLRTFCRPRRFWDEERIPYTDEKYKFVKMLLNDSESNKIFNLLINGKKWDSPKDECHIVKYSEMGSMLYCEDNYWNTYSFGDKTGEIATVVDGGAYIGDSIRPILKNIPEKMVHYYAFEPDSAYCKQIEEEWNMIKPKGDIRIFNSGLGREKGVMYFSESDVDSGGFITSEGECPVNIISIDEADLQIEGKLYIKMDIEGSELDALIGAEKTIKKHRPFLAICVYHRKNDLVEIPLYINSILADYNYYLRGGTHTILWAIPKECDNN